MQSLIRTPYEGLLEAVLYHGEEKEDRTGTGTYSLFGTSMHFDLREGFPLITTKEVFWKGVVEELLWMLRGETNIASLQEAGVHIWDEWANEDGELGPVYGAMWRSWPAVVGDDIDQIRNVVEQIRNNPDSRRLIVTAWNPEMVPHQALPPCHMIFQFYVSPPEHADSKRRLSCMIYQRSCDTFLGVPFNIASYALLVHIIARVTDLDVGELFWVGGDTHIYRNHREQVIEQLRRSHKGYPRVTISPDVTSIDNISADQIFLNGYFPHGKIAAPVAV